MSAALRVLSHLPLQLLEPVRREHPDVLLTQVPMQGDPPADAVGEVLLTHARGSPNFASVVGRGVRWVHTYGTGVNAFPFDALGDRLLTCSRGASGGPIAALQDGDMVVCLGAGDITKWAAGLADAISARRGG